MKFYKINYSCFCLLYIGLQMGFAQDLPIVKTILSDTSSFYYTNFDYKYGRNAGTNQEYTRTVPFSKSNIPIETSRRFQKQIPKIYELLLNSNLNLLLSSTDKW